MKSRYDAVVVGARCAGAATAMLLARDGAKVLAVEQARYGSDTNSTHALMRGGVLQLHRWGVLDRVRAAGTPPVRSTSFHYGEETIAIPIKPRHGIDALYSPRRTVLDRLLVDAARESGAEVVHGARVADLVTAGNRVSGVVVSDPENGSHEIEAGIVIGADGARSKVADLVGAAPYRRGRHATAVIYGYWSGLDVDANHWHFRAGVSVGVIPTNEGETLVFVSMPPGRFVRELRFDLEAGHRRVLVECAPELAETVSRGARRAPLRGFPGAPGHLRPAWGPGWALVGDAGYFRDPLTAHGITDALRDAELLARAVGRDSTSALADYQATRDDLVTRFFDATDEVASFEWDLERVKDLHLALSEEMNREVRFLSEIDSGRTELSRRTA